MSGAPLVDSHFHIYTTDLPLTDTAWHHPGADAGLDLLLDTFDRHGVTFGVIAAASLQGTYNDHVRRALRQTRRLRATAILEPDTDIYQMESMKADGFVGVRLMFGNRDDIPDIDSFEYRAFFRRIADLDWHVHLVDRQERYARHIALIEAQGPKLVIDHFSMPDPERGVDSPGFKAVLESVQRGRTWVKLSAGFRQTPPSVAKTYAAALLKHAGSDRLVWGSDWPFAAFEDRVSYGDCVSAFEDWVPDAAVRWKIGGETPLRLYFT